MELTFFQAIQQRPTAEAFAQGPLRTEHPVGWLPVGVVLREKGPQRRRGVCSVGGRQAVTLPVDQLPALGTQHRHRRLRARERDTEHIGLPGSLAVGVAGRDRPVPGLVELLDRVERVPQIGGPLELLALCGGLHLPAQRPREHARLTTEKALDCLDIGQVRLAVYLARAGSGTEPDSVVQTGPVPPRILVLGTATQAVHLPERLYYTLDATLADERAKHRRIAVGVACHPNLWHLVGGQRDERIELVVFQADVVPRPVPFDEGGLQQQGL